MSERPDSAILQGQLDALRAFADSCWRARNLRLPLRAVSDAQDQELDRTERSLAAELEEAKRRLIRSGFDTPDEWLALEAYGNRSVEIVPQGERPYLLHTWQTNADELRGIYEEANAAARLLTIKLKAAVVAEKDALAVTMPDNPSAPSSIDRSRGVVQKTCRCAASILHKVFVDVISETVKKLFWPNG